ncbi:MAG TPA: FecR domain-containing protein [Terriglobales bacterium]|nr:FecR domain-containing protein [Terriglobales bacterium]
MNPFDRNKIDLDQLISEVRGQQLEDKDLKLVAGRVWTKIQDAAATESPSIQTIHGCEDVRALLPAYFDNKLPENRALVLKNHLHECAVCRQHAYGLQDAQQTVLTWKPTSPTRRAWSFGLPQFAMAALVLVVGFATYFVYHRYYAQLPSEGAQLMSAEGSVYGISESGERELRPGDYVGQGHLIRTAANSHAFVRLLDGSVVEMNRRSEVSVAATRRNTTVHLDQGDIIVQAAKRKTGHLYVMTPDCRVSVTGTVFSVNSGTKGSRVSVIEGQVLVAQQAGESVLHPGDQVTTSPSISSVPIQQEIAWSQNFDQHMKLLVEFAKLQNKLEQIPAPPPRYDSAILPLLPKNTSFFLSIPNLGPTLGQANQIFQQQLQESPVLQQWWTAQNKGKDGPSLNKVIAELQALSQYLGDEIAVAGDPRDFGPNSGPVVLAIVKSSGLKDFMQTEFAKLCTDKNGQTHLQVLEPQQLAQATANSHDLLALVRPDMLVMSTSASALQRTNAQLDAGASGFTGTELGKRIIAAYGRGAGFLLAADLQEIGQSERKMNSSPQHQAALDASGFADMRYLVMEHRDINNQPDNRAVLEFANERHGVASWLAAPAPMRSLDFVSANAGIAVAFISKNPAAIYDDIVSMTAVDPKAQQHLSEADTELNLKVRDDIAATLGGDVTIALDGPVLPQPSWKVVAEVYDAPKLQSSIQQLVNVINQHAAEHNHAGVKLSEETVGGRVFYTVQSLDPAINKEMDYTFADGFILLAPSRALVIQALQTHANGDTLGRSATFKALLPKDEHANFSAVMYQNLGPILQPLASQLNSQQLQLLQQLAADSKPSVICAYGDQDRIEVASNTRFPGLDFNNLALLKLLGARGPHGTTH